MAYNPALQNKLDAFLERVFTSNGFSYDPIGTHKDLRDIDGVYIQKGGGFWLLVDDDDVVGTAGLKIIDNTTPTGELKCLYVGPERQGRGLGQLLINRVVSECKHKKITHVRLDVRKSAGRAINLYRKNGFYGIPRYNDNKNDVIFMELKIE